MGDEINQTHFSAEVFEEFRNRLDMETVILQQWADEGRLHCEQPWAGCELEAWLTDRKGQPSAVNDKFLAALNNEMVVPELAKFNVELNTDPLPMEAGFLDRMNDNLWQTWQQCENTAQASGHSMLMIGILPTIQQADLCMQNQSDMKRYRALNEQIFRLRNGAPLHLDIRGQEHLETDHNDVMLEAAATSLQIHYKVDIDQAVQAYNASRVLSAAIVALAANSPFLFGHDLWAESRIPLFEQAVQVGGSAYANRVTFGLRHAGHSIMECFEANRTRFPSLLPQLMDTPPEQLAHLRLHNGTIWRWNRPLIGFDPNGEPHLRIEHRTPAAGPSMQDVMANTAFYFGALTAMLNFDDPIEASVPNRDAAHNFYACAREGLSAKINWLGKRDIPVRELILQSLLPLAHQGLQQIGCAASEAEHWLGIIEQRAQSGLNGAAWQRRWVAEHGPEFDQLVLAYQAQQASNRPVHTWRV